jgi:hypothetical protein
LSMIRYAAYINSLLPTFRDKLSVPSSRVQQSKKMGPVGCPETSVTNYKSTMCNIPEERRPHFYRDGSLISRKRRHVSCPLSALLFLNITASDLTPFSQVSKPKMSLTCLCKVLNKCAGLAVTYLEPSGKLKKNAK